MALDDRLPIALDGETLWIEGRITGLPEVRDNVIRFEMTDITGLYDLPKRIRFSRKASR